MAEKPRLGQWERSIWEKKDRSGTSRSGAGGRTKGIYQEPEDSKVELSVH